MAKYAQVFNAAGGRADFKLYELKDTNGHLLFKRDLPLWERDVDGFLRTTGMLPPPAVAAAAMPSFPAWAEATCD